jgi:hypothetical protein
MSGNCGSQEAYFQKFSTELIVLIDNGLTMAHRKHHHSTSRHLPGAIIFGQLILKRVVLSTSCSCLPIQAVAFM